MSLQFANVRNGFATSCASIWDDWLTGAASIRRNRRAAKFTAAITQATGFMVTPNVQCLNMGGWGSFNWTNWSLKLNRKYLASSTTYKDFVEFCSSAYHETRHAEQFYRIAQGLAAGTLKFPDQGKASTINAMNLGQRSVASRIAAFQNVAQGGDPLAGNATARANAIARWLSIPVNVAQHANTHRDFFANWINSGKPAWYKRPTALDEVNEWMRATYKKSYSEMDNWAQGPAGPYKVYRDLPEENDAHGIEDQVAAAIFARIGRSKATAGNLTRAQF